MEALATCIALGESAKQVYDFCERFHNVKKDSQPTRDLHEQARRDLAYARQCRAMVINTIEVNDTQREWITGTIEQATRALEEFYTHLYKKREDYNHTEVIDRVKYLVRDMATLDNLEKSLKYSHNSLLAVINLMHLLAMQQNAFNEPASLKQNLGFNQGCTGQELSGFLSSVSRAPGNAN